MPKKQKNKQDLIGIISKIQRTYYQLYCGGKTHRVDLINIIDKELVKNIAIGDRVKFLTQDSGIITITESLPRTSSLTRLRESGEREKMTHTLAANIDYAVVVATAASPAFHPRQIDRYLVMCESGGVLPVICINKVDLAEENPDVSIYEQLNIPIVFISTKTNAGLIDLKNILKEKIAVLVGQSGVGKSSITNVLLGQEINRTGIIGAKTHRGRHTTTHSSLHEYEKNSFIIDTPGVRSLGVFKIPKKDLPYYFKEFRAYLRECKFNDCSHFHEPKCAVKKAVAAGGISKARYDSYIRILQNDGEDSF